MSESFDRLEPISNIASQMLEDIGDDVRKLGEPFKTVAIIFAAQGVIDNGGLPYFFDADWPGSPPYSLVSDAYRRIGMTDAADAIDHASRTFGIENPECDASFRRKFMYEQFGEMDGEGLRNVKWNDCICGDKTVWDRLYHWAILHGGEQLR